MRDQRSWELKVEGCGGAFAYLWFVGNGGMVVIVVIIVPHSPIHY